MRLPLFKSPVFLSGDKLIFIVAVSLHVFFWAFLPVFFMPNYHLDSMEMMVIGQNWVISTYNHPAFQAWVVEILSLIFFRAEFVPYLAAQIACVLSVFFVWRFAQKLLEPRLALLAALTLLSYFYFHFDSMLYNNRTFMRLFWVLAIYFLYLALERNWRRDWVFVGIFLGLGLYCKFTLFVLILTILLFMFLVPSARRYWKTSGPYISTGVCLFVTLPLLIWLAQNYTLMFGYTLGSIGKTTPTIWDHIKSPTTFFVAQIPIVLLLLIPIYFLLGVRWRFDVSKFSSFAGYYLSFFIFVPLMLQCLIAFFCAGDMRFALGCHLWLLLPLFLLYVVKSEARMKFYSRSIKIVFINIFVFAIITILITQMSPVFTGKAARYHFPGKELARKVKMIWADQYSVPLEFVRGEDWLTEVVCVYSRPSPKVYSKLWATEAEFVKSGGVLLWLESESGKIPSRTFHGRFGNNDFKYSPKTGKPDEWLKQFPNAIKLPTIELDQKTIAKVPPIKICIAIVPPNKTNK
ncbi:MAG: glycosyltransferase family 39 protein [Planctomycetaceae bacterium]|jgi:4-amino-4-deoxy-L-arabinose transferase-like glycosyltransferase|nr:glycosyltransferase family 39 protein [Planctomycetaceae bacterium]